MTAPILVVDDDAANRLLLEEILQAEGYRVITACDGLEALEEVRNCAPEVVLLDVMMPGLNGFEVFRRLKFDPDTRSSRWCW